MWLQAFDNLDIAIYTLSHVISYWVAKDVGLIGWATALYQKLEQVSDKGY